MTFWGVPPVWIFHACLEPLFGVVFLHQNVATEPCLSSIHCSSSIHESLASQVLFVMHRSQSALWNTWGYVSQYVFTLFMLTSRTLNLSRCHELLTSW